MTLPSYKLLLLGNGAREAALLCRLLRSEYMGEMHLAPPHALVPHTEKIVFNVRNLNIEDIKQVVAYAQSHEIDLVIPGSEVILALGVQDALRKVGIYCFGPSKAAAQIETSKEFSKMFMKKYNINTAAYMTFNDAMSAKDYIKTHSLPVVIKASGLASGKGVVIASTYEAADAAIDSLMIDKVFGDSGNTIIIEEHINGEEVSFLAFADGYTSVPLPPAQDYKRVNDNDQGPNTGGMGAIAPVPWVTQSLKNQILETVINPALAGLRKEGFPFCGILYAGLMIRQTDGGLPEVFVLEFNARFGDPETQTLMHLLDLQCDLLLIMMACVQGRLDSVEVKFINGSAATVVCASAGYPGNFEKNISIDYQLDESCTSYEEEELHVYIGGALCDPNGKLFTSAGRVLSASCMAKTLDQALQRIYDALRNPSPFVRFSGMHYRRDIGQKFLKSSLKLTGSSYAEAGVNIDLGNEFVEQIKSITRLTARNGADAEIGGFGGIFDASTIMKTLSHPLLVSSTDGVGTKVLIAKVLGKLSTIGIDLVAMNVNDLLVQGAEPLFFLDYYATSHLKLKDAIDVVEGIAEGCLESGCALIGGETAEMPGLYREKDFDLAGFAVGIVDKPHLLPKLGSLRESDVILGLSSTGFHSNGYSLIRHIFNLENIDLGDLAVQSTWGSDLLEPTRIYVPYIVPILKSFPTIIKAMAHITGGGFVDNIPRVLPPHLQAIIDWESWYRPPIFDKIRNLGKIDLGDMTRTWNCGIGLIIVVDEKSAELLITLINKAAESVKLSNKRRKSDPLQIWKIGYLQEKASAGEQSVVIRNLS